MPNLIQEEFVRRFKDFQYPFKTADQVINKMSPSKRSKYYTEASKINKSPVMIQELNEICRHLYYKLAVETGEDEQGKLERALYRGALMFASIFKNRFNSLSVRDDVEVSKQLDEVNKKIDELIE